MFDSAKEIVIAARSARVHGYTKMDAFTPHPIPELDHELGIKPTRIGWVMLAAAIAGALLGYGMQYYASVYSYPLNVGGRPLHSWPSFIPITFELTVLCSALAGVVAMFARNGLPRPHHPLFEIEDFRRASRDRYFLCVHHSDPRFDADHLITLLRGFHADAVFEVPACD